MDDLFTFTDEERTVRPYSGLNGTDPEALKILLSVHAVENPTILDCTYNAGKMWRGIRDRYNITTLDIDPKYETDIIGDFRQLPALIDRKFDVLVFDPPHLPNHAASINSSKIWEDQYGLTDNNERSGDNVNDLFRPFFAAAKQVTNPNGIILCKIVDMVHNHRYQWQHIALIQAAEAEHLTPCDMLVKIDPCGGNLKSSKWKTVYHLRRNHCFWIVIRNGVSCEK